VTIPPEIVEWAQYALAQTRALIKQADAKEIVVDADTYAMLRRHEDDLSRTLAGVKAMHRKSWPPPSD
jgi:hypothetical protein